MPFNMIHDGRDSNVSILYAYAQLLETRSDAEVSLLISDHIKTINFDLQPAGYKDQLYGFVNRILSSYVVADQKADNSPMYRKFLNCIDNLIAELPDIKLALFEVKCNYLLRLQLMAAIKAEIDWYRTVNGLETEFSLNLELMYYLNKGYAENEERIQELINKLKKFTYS